MLELNDKAFKERDDWYYRYASVLLQEIAEFRPAMTAIKDSPVLRSLYGDSSCQELLHLYTCILGIIRFLEVRHLQSHNRILIRGSTGATQYS